MGGAAFFVQGGAGGQENKFSGQGRAKICEAGQGKTVRK